MVNNNVQGAIRLQGPGEKFKLAGDYKPGEYKVAKNVELTPDGTLRTRRSFIGSSTLIQHSTNGTSPFSKFAGSLGEDNIVSINNSDVSARKQLRMSSSTVNNDLWDASLLAANEYIAGVVDYNSKYYWIVQNRSTRTIYLYHHASASLPSITFANLTKVTAVTPLQLMKKHFMHKDRLFIASSDGLYWSKATEPTEWSVPDGGFVKTPGRTINDAVAVGNSIYILTNKGIDIFTYSSDPNQDAQLRNIVPNVTAFSAVVHDNLVYVLTNTGVFTLINNYLEPLFIWDMRYPTTWDDTVINVNDDTLYIKGLLENSLIAYNLQTKFRYTVTLADRFDHPEVNGDYLTEWVDMIPNVKDTIDKPGLQFLLVNRFYENNVYQEQYALYIQETTRYGTKQIGSDYVVKSDGTLVDVMPDTQIEFSQVSPDGLKYFKKKYRELALTARIPLNNIIIEFSFDTYEYKDSRKFALLSSDNIAVPWVDQNADDPFIWGPTSADDPISHQESLYNLPEPGDKRGPYTYRLPINQRANSMNVRIRSIEQFFQVPLPTNSTYPYDKWGFNGILEITDIRYLWSPTNRIVDNRSNLSVP